MASVASAQELPPPGDQGGQAYLLLAPESQFNIISAGILIPMECTNFTTHEEVKNLPRKGYRPSYLPDYTTCFKWTANDEYEGDTIDGKCIRMRYGSIGRMRQIKASGYSETLLKYGISQENVYEFGFVFEQDYDRAKKLRGSHWLPFMTVLEYSC